MSVKPLADAGAWNGDLDQLMSTSPTGHGADATLPEALRFLLAVRRLTRRREREPDCELDRTAALVLVPPAFFESAPANTRRTPFLNTGNYRLTGQVHFVNSAAAGHSLDYAGDDGALIDILNASKVGSMPTVIYAPKPGDHSKLSWYPNGVCDQTTVTIYSVAVEEPKVELVMQAINGVYEGHLKTPDQIPTDSNPWADAGRGRAADNAEALVQQAVKLGLHGRFPQCRIVAEQPGKDGRTDIEVVGDFGVELGAVTNFAVLEMKVLREKGSNGAAYSARSIEKHMDEGVNQASTYGDDRNFRDRLLCCFDMRATNAGASAVFAPIQGKAENLGVQLGFWFLYRSSKHYRECQVAAKLKSG